MDCRRANGRSELHIKDNGAGFDMVYADRLFEPFERFHDQTDFDGNGVGLATVKRIAELHGGAIRAAGAVGAGASFVLSLPSG